MWLQTEVKGNLFWAYNREHLAEIENFVASDLRKSQPNGHYTKSMVAWLPKFIIEAKNREAILKAIRRMRERVV